MHNTESHYQVLYCKMWTALRLITTDYVLPHHLTDRSNSIGDTNSLVHFEIPVDVFDKHEGGEEWSCAYHEEEDVAGEDGVAKELNSLEGAVHVRALVVVKHGIAKHEQTSRAAESKGGRGREMHVGGGVRERE